MCDENGSWVVNLTLCGSQYSVPYTVCSKHCGHYTALIFFQIVQKFAFKRGEEENEDVDDTIDFETMR